MLNWAIYSYNVNKPQIKSNESDTCSVNGNQDGKSSTNDFISIVDLVVPMSLSLLLSLIHSQIVATSSANLSASDRLNKGLIQPHRKKRERKKRRKSTRSRLSLNTLETKSRTNSLTEEKEAIETNVQISSRLSTSQQQPQQQQQQPQKENEASNSNCTPPRLRKRNVNWRSPIKSNSSIPDTRNVLDMEEEMAEIQDTDNHNENETIGADDDGFESLNGKSSSGEEMSALNNGQVIESNVEHETMHRGSGNSGNQQYTNSAYLMGSFDENDANNNSDNEINGTNGISENVS